MREFVSAVSSRRESRVRTPRKYFPDRVFRFFIIFRVSLMAIYGERTRPTLFRSFFSAPLHPIAERNRIYRTKVILGGMGKIQFECSVKRRVQTPYTKCPSIDPALCASKSFRANPFLHPRTVPLHRARHSSSVAQHMHTKYIKRPAPVPKYGVVYSKVV